MSTSSSEISIKRGLEGVVAAESNISFIDGIGGRLYYRGYTIENLANNCSYEEVAYLLIYGKLPNKKELSVFSNHLKRNRELPKQVIDAIKDTAKYSNSMEALRTAVSALASEDKDSRELSINDQLKEGISLVAKMPTIVAYHYRIKNSKKIVHPDNKLGHAANFLYMLEAELLDPDIVKAMDMDMVLHADHGLNASTFALRVTISTLSDIHSAFTTGIGTLKGPLHGGAAEQVMLMLEKIGTLKNIDPYVDKVIREHGRIMGFGHRIYKTYDPRARVLKKAAERTSREENNMKWFDMCNKLEVVMEEKKGLYPNVDFYSAIVYKNLGIPLEVDTSIFAIGRSAGWVAHAIEQYNNNRLIRPLEKYTGELDLEFMPLKRRK